MAFRAARGELPFGRNEACVLAACLNDEQMGEGWSDFFSLIMTHEPGDQGVDNRGIGNFADAQTISSKGIKTIVVDLFTKLVPWFFKDLRCYSHIFYSWTILLSRLFFVLASREFWFVVNSKFL